MKFLSVTFAALAVLATAAFASPEPLNGGCNNACLRTCHGSDDYCVNRCCAAN
ncbi:hypothetical protein Unana1_01767 [Umbelopsis nana]